MLLNVCWCVCVACVPMCARAGEEKGAYLCKYQPVSADITLHNKPKVYYYFIRGGNELGPVSVALHIWQGHTDATLSLQMKAEYLTTSPLWLFEREREREREILKGKEKGR